MPSSPFSFRPRSRTRRSQADRGPGCSGSATLACDLDFLAGDLVATVRISAVVREAGSLAFAAVSSAQPSDPQPANDTSRLSTVVRPAPVAVPAQVSPSLRAVGTPARPTRARGVATVWVRFSVGGAARLEARLTPSGSTRPITLLAGTTLAGTRSTKARTDATGRAPRAASLRLQGPCRRCHLWPRPRISRQTGGRRRRRPAPHTDDPRHGLTQLQSARMPE